MNSWRLLNLALAALVTIGLTMAPLAAPPSIAAHSQPAGMNDMSMSDDMPCCPDDHRSKDCGDCPLVAICILKSVQAGPALAAALPLRHAIWTLHSLRDDVLADGLARPPPDHPPRSLA
jgi:hypothetical protein